MRSFPTSTFLRRVLFADAATCVACGLLLAFGAGRLEQLLGLPAGLSRYAGLSLLPFAAFLGYLATRENLSQKVVWWVIILNALWTIDSILLLMSGWVAPTGLGAAFIVFQAVGVAMFAALEYFGLRKSAAAATA
ncbi:MAG: hypothetical protein H0X14_09450 [Acidobacteria bacterium]|nr:hypothetical protein [Acidobacteriota bacterium]